MSRFFDLVSKPVRDMGSYLPPRALSRGDSQSPRHIRLDSNENPFGPSPRALEAMRLAITGVNSYPEDDCTELRRKLAAHHGLPPEQVLVTAGSTALLALLCQTLLAPGFNAVTSEHSLFMGWRCTRREASSSRFPCAMTPSIWPRFSIPSTSTRVSCSWRIRI